MKIRGQGVELHGSLMKYIQCGREALFVIPQE